MAEFVLSTGCYFISNGDIAFLTGAGKSIEIPVSMTPLDITDAKNRLEDKALEP